MRTFVGYCMIGSPFVVVFAFIAVTDSLLVACATFAITAVVVGIIAGGVRLIDS